MGANCSCSSPTTYIITENDEEKIKSDLIKGNPVEEDMRIIEELTRKPEKQLSKNFSVSNLKVFSRKGSPMLTTKFYQSESTEDDFNCISCFKANGSFDKDLIKKQPQCQKLFSTYIFCEESKKLVKKYLIINKKEIEIYNSGLTNIRKKLISIRLKDVEQAITLSEKKVKITITDGISLNFSLFGEVKGKQLIEIILFLKNLV